MKEEALYPLIWNNLQDTLLIQYLVINLNGKECEKEDISVCGTESFCYISETNTAL